MNDDIGQAEDKEQKKSTPLTEALNVMSQDGRGNQYRKTLDMRILRNDYSFGYQMAIVVRDTLNQDIVGFVQELEIVPNTDPACSPRPIPIAAVLEEDTVQTLMNQLWSLGIRPTEMRAKDVPTETLEAQREHMKDLQETVKHEREWGSALWSELKENLTPKQFVVKGPIQQTMVPPIFKPNKGEDT